MMATKMELFGLTIMMTLDAIFCEIVPKVSVSPSYGRILIHPSPTENDPSAFQPSKDISFLEEWKERQKEKKLKDLSVSSSQDMKAQFGCKLEVPDESEGSRRKRYQTHKPSQTSTNFRVFQVPLMEKQTDEIKSSGGNQELHSEVFTHHHLPKPFFQRFPPSLVPISFPPKTKQKDGRGKATLQLHSFLQPPSLGVNPTFSVLKTDSRPIHQNFQENFPTRLNVFGHAIINGSRKANPPLNLNLPLRKNTKEGKVNVGTRKEKAPLDFLKGTIQRNKTIGLKLGKNVPNQKRFSPLQVLRNKLKSSEETSTDTKNGKLLSSMFKISMLDNLHENRKKKLENMPRLRAHLKENTKEFNKNSKIRTKPSIKHSSIPPFQLFDNKKHRKPKKITTLSQILKNSRNPSDQEPLNFVSGPTFKDPRIKIPIRNVKPPLSQSPFLPRPPSPPRVAKILKRPVKVKQFGDHLDFKNGENFVDSHISHPNSFLPSFGRKENHLVHNFIEGRPRKYSGTGSSPNWIRNSTTVFANTKNKARNNFNLRPTPPPSFFPISPPFHSSGTNSNANHANLRPPILHIIPQRYVHSEHINPALKFHPPRPIFPPPPPFIKSTSTASVQNFDHSTRNFAAVSHPNFRNGPWPKQNGANIIRKRPLSIIKTLNYPEHDPQQPKYFSQTRSASGWIRKPFKSNSVAPFFTQPPSYTPERNPSDGDQEDIPSSYEYKYVVDDANRGIQYGHAESRREGSASGEYFVKLPDGRTQHVTYVADENGYKADVKYFKTRADFR